MRRHLALLGLTLLVAAPTLAQEPAAGVRFSYQGRSVEAPRWRGGVEAVPVLALIGAEAGFSPAAGTWGVVYGDHLLQFTPGHRLVLADGVLLEMADAPETSPSGVAVSLRFLERGLLAPLGFRLERIGDDLHVVPGARFDEPLVVRPAAADFAATTTLVLTLDRAVPATVTVGDDGLPVVRFERAAPRLDGATPFRSERVRALVSDGASLVLRLADGVGLLSWHVLDNPPRVILELGRARPTPAQAPVRIVEREGPPPIVVDPGHGGDDIGARSGVGLLEKNLTLAIARQVQRVLETRGHTVRLTRSSDEARALTDRTAMANRLEARAFVSLHANASTAASVRGAETYYMSLGQGASDAAAAATAALENQAEVGNPGSSPLDLILWDLAQSEVLNESAELALAVQRRLNELLGLRDRGVKQAPFVVLTGATMPAVLVEVGFLSNPAEAELLTSSEHQQRLAEAIALGIEDYVGRP